MRFFLVILLFVSLSHSVSAEYVFDANCRSAYLAAWSLKPAEVNKYLAQEASKDPSNHLPVYIASLNQFVKVFSSDEKSAYQQFKADMGARLDILNTDKKGPWYLFCRSEIYLQSAVIKLKFADYLSAANDFNKAYNNLTECNAKYPNFLPAQKDLLLLKAMVGSVPDNYRWMLKILGFTGDLKTSVTKYEALIDKMDHSSEYGIFTKESRIIYAYLNYFMMNKPVEAWKQIDLAAKDYATNPLDAFVRANIAMHVKKNDIAIEALSAYVTNPPPIPYLDYMMGIARLQRGDRNAGFYLGRYLKEYNGDHYVKDAWLKLGWAFLLVGDTKHYQSAMQLVPTSGSTQLEEDKNALREAAASKYLVPGILRSRLYFDGGYLDKAKAEIQKVNPGSLSNDRQKSEYYYRYARILDASGNIKQALEYYQVEIDKYGRTSTYFAPAACLYAGMIWEKEGDSGKAGTYYKQCISYKNYDYKDSFDQKAYAGLKRVE